MSAPPLAPSAPARAASAEPRPAGNAYWVEYGAYTTSSYAERLRRSLSALGIETSVNYLPGRGGRHYYSVRSAPVAEQTLASAALAKAGEALHIAPLLHHERLEAGENAVQAEDASPRLEAPGGAERGRYWVQFGVFAVQRFAERFEARLQSGGIATTTSPRLRSSGRTLYYVRSSLLPDRQSAAALAERARTLLGTAVLIGLSETRDKG